MLDQVKYKSLLALGDTCALVLSGVVGLYLRFETTPAPSFLATWFRYMLIAIPLYFVIYYYFGLYSRLWRYASVQDLVTIASAVSIATMMLFGVMYANPRISFPRSVLVMSWFMNVAAVGGMRFFLRIASDHRHRLKNGSKPTLILGAGDAGRILVEEIKKHPELDYRVLGFLDDDKTKIGMKISGVSVLGPLSLLEEIVPAQGVTQVIIAMPSAPLKLAKDIARRCTSLGIKPQTVLGLYRVLGEGVQISTIRDIQIEDLLARPEIKTDCSSIAGYIHGKTVLITGAGGSIGAELSRQVAGFNPAHLLLLGRGENSIYEIHKELSHRFPDLKLTPVIADIQDAHRIEHIFSAHKPQVVFHAAAHKHVPLMEANPTEALKTNVLGTKHVADASARHHVERFVLVSTDKAVNPANVMGATKRMAELLIQTLNDTSNTKFMAVRFGNVLGSRGSVIPLFKEQIARGGPVTVTHPDMTRYFMTVSEAVSLIIQAGAMGHGGEVFVLDMGEPVKIMDLARDIISLSGLKPNEDITIVISGLRPGEKLYEELLTAAEGTIATQHKRIMITVQPCLDINAWRHCLSKVEQLSQHCDASGIISLTQTLSDIVLAQVAATSKREPDISSHGVKSPAGSTPMEGSLPAHG